MLLFIKQNLQLIFPLLLSIITVILIYHFRHWITIFSLSKKRREEKQIKVAERFYGDLLKILAKRKLYRTSNQTPIEFSKALRKEKFSYIEDIELITHNFCFVKYAERTLTHKKLNKIENALKRIRKNKI